MKRDIDLIREILFKLEASEDWLHPMPGRTLGASPEEWKERYYLELMDDEGLITLVEDGAFRMTGSGHDFLEMIRSEVAWNKVKSAIDKVGGMPLRMVEDVAAAYLEKEVTSKLKIEL